MKSLIITATTPQGTTALKEHIQESMKFARTTKAMMKLLQIKQQVIGENPYTLELHIGNKRMRSMLKPTHMINEIKPSLKEKGAEINRDYTIEVIQ